MARVIRGASRPDAVEVLASLERARSEALDALRAELVTLSGEVARRAVLDALEVDPARVEALADQALARVRRATQVTLRVCPADAPRVAGLDVEVLADPSLGPGDCVVESSLGEVDGRIEARIDRLLAALGRSRPLGDEGAR